MFRVIEEHKAELDEMQNTSRCSETSSAKSQSELMKEINALKESLFKILLKSTLLSVCTVLLLLYSTLLGIIYRI